LGLDDGLDRPGNSLSSVMLMDSAALLFFSLDWLVLLLLGVGSSMTMLSLVLLVARMLNGLASLISDSSREVVGCCTFAPCPGWTCVNPSASCSVFVLVLRIFSWGMGGASEVASHPFLFGWMILDFVKALGGEKSPHSPAFYRNAARDGVIGLLVL